MKSNSKSERGQALVLIALAIIGLVGITGLAVDGSSVLADRRHALLRLKTVRPGLPRPKGARF